MVHQTPISNICVFATLDERIQKKAAKVEKRDIRKLISFACPYDSEKVLSLSYLLNSSAVFIYLFHEEGNKYLLRSKRSFNQ